MTTQNELHASHAFHILQLDTPLTILLSAVSRRSARSFQYFSPKDEIIKV